MAGVRPRLHRLVQFLQVRDRRRLGAAPEMLSEDWSKEDGVADAEVHPLATSRRVLVCRVSDETNNPARRLAVRRGQTCVRRRRDGRVHLEPRRPDDLFDLQWLVCPEFCEWDRAHSVRVEVVLEVVLWRGVRWFADGNAKGNAEDGLVGIAGGRERETEEEVAFLEAH